jgi:hypothetical protein
VAHDGVADLELHSAFGRTLRRLGLLHDPLPDGTG